MPVELDKDFTGFRDGLDRVPKMISIPSRNRTRLNMVHVLKYPRTRSYAPGCLGTRTDKAVLSNNSTNI